MAGAGTVTTPDLLYSEVEEELRASVRSLLADRAAPETVLARCEDPDPYDPAVWRTLARDVGAAGLQVPEDLGGAGASLREVAVVLEETGRCVAPVPYLEHTVLAGTALLASGSREAHETLTALAGGARTGTLAVPLAAAPGSGFPAVVRADGSGRLLGRVGSVAGTGPADVLVVPAVDGDGPALYAVEAGAAGLTVSPRVSLDLTRPLAGLGFEGVAARRLADSGTAAAALDQALLTGAGLLAAEQLGIAEWCLETTVAHLRERRQFGRPVGSFQALKHRLADLWLDIVGARAAARNAAGVLAADGPQAPVAVAVAQAHCAAAAVRAAEECVQLHGGIGMTWELPAHLYLKRAKADQIALGTPGHHYGTVAGLTGLQPPPPG